jgi:hypothetical protein
VIERGGLPRGTVRGELDDAGGEGDEEVAFDEGDALRAVREALGEGYGVAGLEVVPARRGAGGVGAGMPGRVVRLPRRAGGEEQDRGCAAGQGQVSTVRLIAAGW